MDAYQRLRPNTDIEACDCTAIRSLLLVDLLSDNPLHCDFCRKEVAPERLQLSVEELNHKLGGSQLPTHFIGCGWTRVNMKCTRKVACSIRKAKSIKLV